MIMFIYIPDSGDIAGVHKAVPSPCQKAIAADHEQKF